MKRKQLSCLSDALGKRLTAQIVDSDEERLLLAFDDDAFVVVRAAMWGDVCEISTEGEAFDRRHFGDDALRCVFDAETVDEWNRQDDEARKANRNRQEALERQEFERLKAKYGT